MINKCKNEYKEITDDIVNDYRFKLTMNDFHHGGTKYNHLVKVSKLCYILSKIFKADTKVTTTAGLLHDLFYGERTLKEENDYLNHPHTAAVNAYNFYNISEEEISAIETHMFHHMLLKKMAFFNKDNRNLPLKVGKPKSKEGYIVMISDLLVSTYESKTFLKYKFDLAFLLIISIFLNK